ncbi:RND family transporter [candidate division KSB1 bacterium]
MKRFIQFVIDNPKKVIVLALILNFSLAAGIPKLHFEEDIKAMIPEDMPSRVTYNELEEVFGGTDVALIGIGNESESIFNVGTLQKIRALTDSLDVFPGINRVTSLATIKYMEGHDWGLEVTPYLEYDPETEEDALRIREMFYNDSTYVGILVSEDGNYTSIIAHVREDAEIKDVYDDITKLAEEFQGPEDIYLAGTPIVTTIISQSMKNDLRRLIPFVILLITILLFVSFRSPTGVLLPLSAVIMSVMSMLGFMGHLGLTFTTVNNIMPVILLGIGIDYGIHVMAHYYQDAVRYSDKKTAILRTITDIGTPMIMACLTTMVGFLSLLTSPLDTHHDFGYMLAFGVMMALIYNMTFVPAFLTLLPVPKKAKSGMDSGFLNSLLTQVGGIVVKFRHGFAAAGLIIAIAAALGIPRVQIEMNPITFFPDDSEIVRADRMVNDHLGGSVNMNILFEGKIQSEAIMHHMDNLEDYLDQFPETGSTMSLAKIVRKINKSLNSNDPAFDRLPEGDPAIAQAILMYETSGDPSDFETIVDNAYEYGQVVAMLKSASTEQVGKITDSVNEYLEKNVDGDVKVRTTGFSVFFKDLSRLIVISQARSITFAVLLVLLIAWATYRRFLLGLFAIIPFAMCVILNFGLMGYLGIDLSIPMAMISSMIIGIGVDFSFHLISRFKLESEKSDTITAVRQAVKRVGQPILYSALTTSCGGLVLMISGFVPVRYLGMMLAMIMAFCAILALTLLASMLTYSKIKQ